MQFFLRQVRRLTASQNKEQKENAGIGGATADRYSYTLYDNLGRIKEVGEKSGADDIREIDMLDSTAVKTWLVSGTDRQITKTIYDDIATNFQNLRTLRKRVAASIFLENRSDSEGDSTLYNYDILGNVKTLRQHIKALVAVDATNGKKQIDYDYDLVSGKVNRVIYQQGKGDQFMYSYLYDADNRVIESKSSRDGLVWRTDASYLYYLHGPLARTELGHLKSQGVDYAYTLQGWLKGINSDSLNPEYDMAKDGHFSTPYGYARVARDVYGYKLGYFQGDYDAVGEGGDAFTYKLYTSPKLLGSGNDLFNDNISNTTIALSKINDGATAGYTYGYDQLNRLVKMRQHLPLGTSWDSIGSMITAYGEDIAYDANGNILKYLRRGGITQPDMDSLSYHYSYDGNGMLLHNKLNHVADQVSSGNYAIDIDEQEEGNYVYDHIGNLTKDEKEGIDDIDWTVYGKFKKIDKASGYGTGEITYGYDPAGNRTSKKLTTSARDSLTFYVRDAQGNVLATYSKLGSDPLTWGEQHLYGSSRLGVWNWAEEIPGAAPNVTGTSLEDSLHVGNRNYELTNHLGNVLATISDKIIGNDSSGISNYFLAESLTQQDYYPFGMSMPGRKFDLSSLKYRYGFNGKEDDPEVEGQQDYGMRIYDKRLGRFKSVDPLTHNYPMLSTYQYASNSPVANLDVDGLESVPTCGVRGIDGKYLVQGDVNGDMVVDKMEREAWIKAMGAWELGGTITILDIFWTKGKLTQFLLGSQFLGAFEHNRGKTPEQQIAQDQRSKDALADAFLIWGGGKMLGVSLNAGVSGLKSLAKNRFNFAKNFYKNAGYSEDRAMAHTKGIDLSKKVFEVELKKGTELEQWTFLDKDGNAILGDYYTFPNADKTKLGISLNDPNLGNRVKTTVILKEDTKFLQSTAGDIENWNKKGEILVGGEIQLFNTKVQVEIKK